MGAGHGSKTSEGRLEHGGERRDSRQWPPESAIKVDYFLHGDGSLSRAPSASAETARITYRFDPAHPVLTIGGGVSDRLKDGAYDQRERKDMPRSSAPYLPLRSRKNILVFETAPPLTPLNSLGDVVQKQPSISSAFQHTLVGRLRHGLEIG